MRRGIGIVLGLVLVCFALASPQPSEASACKVQCTNQRAACWATCNSQPNCIASCQEAWEACYCNVCHYCI